MVEGIGKGDTLLFLERQTVPGRYLFEVWLVFIIYTHVTIISRANSLLKDVNSLLAFHLPPLFSSSLIPIFIVSFFLSLISFSRRRHLKLIFPGCVADLNTNKIQRSSNSFR